MRKISILLGWCAWLFFYFTDMELADEVRSSGYAMLADSLGLDVSELNFWVLVVPMIIWYYLCGLLFPVPQITFAENNKPE
jgi:hypothetical protein